MRRHAMATTTRTVELRQVREINARLPALVPRAPGDPTPWRLLRLDASGPPSYPYLYATFAALDGSARQVVPMHTAQLQAVSRALGLRHVWGVSCGATDLQRAGHG